MLSKRSTCIWTFALLTLCQIRADSLSTSFVDVVVLNVPLGQSRKVENQKKEGLVVWNTEESTLDVSIAILKPEPKELKGPVEAIPDPSWIKVEPSHLTLGPHERKTCDVILLLPKDRHLAHRTFQAMVWTTAHPQSTAGVTFGAGLKSRLRFQTAR